MKRLSIFVFAVWMIAATSQAQTPPTEPQKPKPGQIIEQPESGRIIAAPTPPPASAALTGQRIERFEATGNTSVASDTIRVYLGINPGDPYDPAALQRNFLNLWQTGLFDDIRIETDKGDQGGVVVRAIVKERPRISSVEFRGNKELNNTKINEQLERDKVDLHVGNTIEQNLVRRAAESIKKAYTEAGYEGVTVNNVTEDTFEPSEKRVVFIINEGIKATVNSIEFTGN
ncbi:MAG TPA: POTRA domain-containing protein, partial [Thermoanaerobaculia bacterium]|nr:POTRA domain-containing protein [Thermoanaerobaculia bacterium]